MCVTMPPFSPPASRFLSYALSAHARLSARPSVGQTALDGRAAYQSPLDGKRAHISPPLHLIYSPRASDQEPLPSLVSYRVPLDRERGLFALMHSLTLWHFIGPIHLRQKANREGGQSRPQRSNTHRAPCLGSQTYSGVLNHSKTFLRIDL